MFLIKKAREQKQWKLLGTLRVFVRCVNNGNPILQPIIYLNNIRQKVYALMEGQKRIQKYQFSLKKPLGQGSYATVYLGRQLESSKPVAVKVIDKRIFSNAYNVKNIQSEIEIMKKVSHQNIVQMHDIYQTSNNMYIVTELCQDGDLFKLLQKRRKIGENEAKKYLRDIMNGAMYLHKNGIIHRDLKPANILLKDGVCKLSDFGFAKSLTSEEVVMKSIVGTPLYMSPQILKKGKYTAKSDLWSVGLIYYEMLHGRTPWPAQNELELINGIYHKKVMFSPEISDHSRDFIRKCLQICEEDRISWEEASRHRLLNDHVVERKSFGLDVTRSGKGSKLILEDKENNACFANKNNKTPTNKGAKKQNKSPFGIIKTPKDLSGVKPKRQEQCLTPKGRLTPKARTNISNIKQRLELLNKRENEDSSTIKKARKISNYGKVDNSQH